MLVVVITFSLYHNKPLLSAQNIYRSCKTEAHSPIPLFMGTLGRISQSCVGLSTDLHAGNLCTQAGPDKCGGLK